MTATLLGGLALCLALPASAESSRSQTVSVAPVAALFPVVQTDYEGDILKIDLVAAGRGWNYQVKLLTPEGDVLKLDYDARTLKLLRSLGQGQDAIQGQNQPDDGSKDNLKPPGSTTEDSSEDGDSSSDDSGSDDSGSGDSGSGDGGAGGDDGGDDGVDGGA